MSTTKIELLCYGLVLLQEICQGYDNGNYRLRATRYFSNVGYPPLGNYLIRWRSRAISTTCLIKVVENSIEQLTKGGGA